jgi:hypothetical protein
MLMKALKSEMIAARKNLKSVRIAGGARPTRRHETQYVVQKFKTKGESQHNQAYLHS